jgi:hypothetical protein
MNFLTEPHTMRIGHKVLVSVRNNPNECYEGTIYNIVNGPMNKGIPNTDFVDHFYITFAAGVYAKLLMRGSEIVYQHGTRVIGRINTNSARDQIKNMTMQYPYSNTILDANPKNINAMLVWRVAYNITSLC